MVKIKSITVHPEQIIVCFEDGKTTRLTTREIYDSATRQKSERPPRPFEVSKVGVDFD